MADLRVTTQAVAHRGDPYHFRENTLASVRSALLKGADVVEVDVRTSRDGVPVLLHDPTLERLWGSDRPVAELSAAEVFLLTRGGVPTLAEALAELDRHRTGRLLLDLPDEGHTAAAAVAAVKASGAADRVYFCGELPAMVAVRVLDPTAEIAMTWKTSRRPPTSLLADLGPRWLNLRFPLADSRTIDQAREEGLLVAVWTADWQRSMARLVRHGVDAITTNRLETLQRLLARHTG
ncbi:glycerophosphodiester phosphodiesterase [Streptomyces sp. NBC_01190]|uniref:glycerophosphodiester phosphodiesterase n=1 Tax=Streptomyces sp. NBC_01190 TaxID=2903767 RepID=UPI0038686E0C|nr:glycerophosphodiester phosphodiesterase [Streptomyces sp. NBC_01190]